MKGTASLKLLSRYFRMHLYGLYFLYVTWRFLSNPTTLRSWLYPSFPLPGCSLTFPKLVWSHPPAVVPWTCLTTAPPLTDPHRKVRSLLYHFPLPTCPLHPTVFPFHHFRYRMLDSDLWLMLFFYRWVRVWVGCKFRSSTQAGNAVQPGFAQQIQVLMREVLLPVLIQHAELQQEPPIEDHLSAWHSRFIYFYF